MRYEKDLREANHKKSKAAEYVQSTRKPAVSVG